MGRKAKYHGGVAERGLGMEIRQLRQKARLSMEEVGEVLDWSANTISRLERGLRPDTKPEEISALLAAMGVKGKDRDRIMRIAFGNRNQGWWEDQSDALPLQDRTFLKFERRATRIFNVQPLLVPGLLQTADYCRALLRAFGYAEEELESKIARRLGRQAILSRPQPPEAEFIVTELLLRQPVGGPAVMARQVRRIIDEAERPHITVRIIPVEEAVHPALDGPFLILDFAEEPSIVMVGLRRSAVYPENREELETYMLAAERLTRQALDEEKSLRMLRSIAKDLERAR
jgi:transcriptional regulator with XRE-family HTH domain